MINFRNVLNIKVVRAALDFGINDNVKLTRIDLDTRSYEGEPVNRNTFMTFTKFDTEGNKIASSEFSYFNLDHTSDFVFDNLVQQVGQLNTIATLLGSDEEIDPVKDFSTQEELVESLKTKKGCNDLMRFMKEDVEKIILPLINEKSPLLRIKVVTDSKGKWLQLPREARFAELMSDKSNLSISAYENKMYMKGLEESKPEADNSETKPVISKKSLLKL